MKCPNCYSRKINSNICEMCGINIETFKKKKKSNKIMILILLFILIIAIFIFAFGKINYDKVINLFKSFPGITKFKQLYGSKMKFILGILAGITSLILLFDGSLKKQKLKNYDSYLLGKIVDYRPSHQKGRYHPILEYEVNERKYRVVARSIKTKELYGLIGVRYERNNPISAIVDGEKNPDLEFILGIIILIIVFVFI